MPSQAKKPPTADKLTNHVMMHNTKGVQYIENLKFWCLTDGKPISTNDVSSWVFDSTQQSEMSAVEPPPSQTRNCDPTCGSLASLGAGARGSQSNQRTLILSANAGFMDMEKDMEASLFSKKRDLVLTALAGINSAAMTVL